MAGSISGVGLAMGEDDRVLGHGGDLFLPDDMGRADAR